MEGIFARMHPVAKRVFYRKRINELEAFQPKCQQMTFKLFCNHCDKFTDDADFDHCMTESSNPVETPAMRALCVRELLEALGKGGTLPQTRRLSAHRRRTRCGNRRATMEGWFARMHPVAKRVFYRKRLNELEAFQPKCQQMTFKLFCNHCDKFTDDADFDDCMMESNPVEPPGMKALCLRENLNALEKVLSQKRKLRAHSGVSSLFA